jgi:hypothetical protein
MDDQEVHQVCHLIEQGATVSQATLALDSARAHKKKHHDSQYLHLTGLLECSRKGVCSAASVFVFTSLVLDKLSGMVPSTVMSKTQAFVETLKTRVNSEVQRILTTSSAPCETHYRTVVDNACTRCCEVLACLLQFGDQAAERKLDELLGLSVSLEHPCLPRSCAERMRVNAPAFTMVSAFDWAPNDFVLAHRLTLTAYQADAKVVFVFFFAFLYSMCV